MISERTLGIIMEFYVKMVIFLGIGLLCSWFVGKAKDDL